MLAKRKQCTSVQLILLFHVFICLNMLILFMILFFHLFMNWGVTFTLFACFVHSDLSEILKNKKRVKQRGRELVFLHDFMFSF